MSTNDIMILIVYRPLIPLLFVFLFTVILFILFKLISKNNKKNNIKNKLINDESMKKYCNFTYSIMIKILNIKFNKNIININEIINDKNLNELKNVIKNHVIVNNKQTLAIIINYIFKIINDNKLDYLDKRVYQLIKKQNINLVVKETRILENDIVTLNNNNINNSDIKVNGNYNNISINDDINNSNISINGNNNTVVKNNMNKDDYNYKLSKYYIKILIFLNDVVKIINNELNKINNNEENK